MQKTLKFVLLIFISLFLYSLIGAASAANTYIVNDSSYSNYFNTTGYITNSNVQAGDVLECSGTLTNKNLYIDRPLNITGSITAQIINGTITILPGGSGTIITNLKINNSNENGIGIFLYGTENNTIKGNQIHCNGPDGFGIALTCSNKNAILNNTVITTQRSGTVRTHTAVVLGNSTNNTIENNTIKSDGANCIYLSAISSGKFESNGPSNNNYIINNTCVGVDTQWCYAIQIGSSAGSNNTVENNKIISQTFPEKASSYCIGAYRGISSEDEGGNTITDNIISAAYYGIYATSNCIISGNTISNYGDEYTGISGIFIAKFNCIVTNNTVKMTNGYGIYITGSKCNVTGNKITTTGTQESIYLYGQINNNTLSGNTINSKSTGILLKKQSSTKQPTHTNITNNHITTAGTYAVNSAEGTNTTITNNYLVADNGNKQGNNAVISGTGDTLTGNYGKKPVADFAVNINKGTQPLIVQFINTSQGDITDWAWDFDNNGVVDCTAQYSTYTYTKPGTYVAKLTVTGPGGIDSKIFYITVQPNTTAPVAKVNIKAGTYKTNQKITLTISEPGTIYYTLNGTTPTTKNKKYTATINITATTTLKYLAVDLAGNKSPVYTQKYTIDTVKPVISSTDPKNGATKIARNKTIKVTFSENIKASSSYWIELVASNGTKIAIKKSIKGKILTITHTAKLKASTKYKLVLHTGAVTDTAGNPLAVKSITFTTVKT